MYKHFVIALLIVSLSACAKTVRFQTSTVVPAANASVKLSKDDNKNTKITMTVTNLADPERLVPSRKTYVVWMQTKNNGMKNIGQLISEKSYFSSARKATLMTTTPFQPTKFIVTAENNAGIAYPEGKVVLSTEDF